MEPNRVLWIGGSPPPQEPPRSRGPWRIDCLPPRVARDRLRTGGYDVVVLEFPMPGWNPKIWLEALAAETPRTAVVLRDSAGTLAAASLPAGAGRILRPGDDVWTGILELLDADRAGAGLPRRTPPRH